MINRVGWASKTPSSPYPSLPLPREYINRFREPGAEPKLLKSRKSYGIGCKDSHGGQLVVGWCQWILLG